MRYFEASPLFSLWVNERFYEKVIKVKADVAALLSGWGSAQGIQQRPGKIVFPLTMLGRCAHGAHGAHACTRESE